MYIFKELMPHKILTLFFFLFVVNFVIKKSFDLNIM